MGTLTFHEAGSFNQVPSISESDRVNNEAWPSTVLSHEPNQSWVGGELMLAFLARRSLVGLASVATGRLRWWSDSDLDRLCHRDLLERFSIISLSSAGALLTARGYLI